MYEKVFYCIYQSDRNVDSNQPVPISKEEMVETLELVGGCEKNYIGFIDSDNVTLQFYVDEINKIWIEIPVVEDQGSYGKHISEKEMIDIVNTLESSFLIYKSKLNLELRKW